MEKIFSIHRIQWMIAAIKLMGIRLLKSIDYFKRSKSLEKKITLVFLRITPHHNVIGFLWPDLNVGTWELHFLFLL